MDKEILSEFAIPTGEVDAPVEVGDFGKLVIEVEAIARLDGVTIFRKHKKARVEGNFRPEGAKELRERLLEKQEQDEK